MKIRYEGFMREKIQRNPVTISPDTSFQEAKNVMQQNHVRHLPVVDKDNELMGLVTYGDIREAAPSDVTLLATREFQHHLDTLPVSRFMTPKNRLITIAPDALIEEAAQMMHDNKISCLPVVENKKLYGIFTETDALSLLVDIFGLEHKGTRLTFAVDDKPGATLGILEVIKKHNINIISIVTPAFIVDGKRLIVVRIKTEDYKDLVGELEKAGYDILSVGKWSSL